MISGKTVSTALVVLFLLSTSMGCEGATQGEFSGGSANVTITFPEAGGSDSTASIDLPRHITVNGAALDLEGRPKAYNAVSGFIDYLNPGGSTAFSGSIANLPPNAKPNNYEGTNITLDRGLQKSDNTKTPVKAPNSVPYHLFEFDLSEVAPADFDFMWEGIGMIYPSVGDPSSAALVFLYNCATNKWDKMASYSVVGSLSDDEVLWANVTSGPSVYLDSRGLLCVMVTIPLPLIGQYTGYIETDYVGLWYNGTRVLYPENVKLDLKGDGSVEWQRPGKLRGKANFTGLQFVNALQAILDASPAGTVRIPLKFSSDKGGILFISNLSIGYDLRNLPPEVNGTIPLLEMDEDTNATALLDLRSWFDDDAGINALAFSIIYQEDSTRLEAALNPDGHHVDFFTRTPNWYGTLRFRARATDIEELSADANFTVRVLSVDDPPKLKTAGTLVAYQGARFEHTFAATDVDLGVDPEERLAFSTNSTYLSIEPDTGLASFTPANPQVGAHLFNLTVTDHYGAADTKNFSLRVENQNDPPSLEEVPDQTATEDEPFLLRVVAADPDLVLGLDELAFEDNSTLFNISSNGTISFVPENRDVGEHRVSVSVRDLAGLKAYANFTITVLNTNDPPRVTPVSDLTVEEDVNVSFRVLASDEDIGDELRFSDNSSLFSINSTGWVSFRPVQKDVGVHQVNVTVTDGAGAIASVLFRITVLNVNDLPKEVRILGPANGTAFTEGEEVGFSGNATDEDGDELNFTWYANEELVGSGASFNTTSLKPGTYTVTLMVSDGSEPVASLPVEITVNQKPAAAASRGFIPGFEIAALAVALAAWMALGRRSRHGLR